MIGLKKTGRAIKVDNKDKILYNKAILNSDALQVRHSALQRTLFSQTSRFNLFRRRIRMAISTGTINHLALTVTNKDRARDFYTNVLGFQFITDFGPKYLLTNGQVILALAEAPDPNRAISSDQFDENRVGLDHVSFSVGSRSDLENALQEFDRMVISHGEIKDLAGLGILVLAFRDPDNIQLELTAPKG
jgi:glyoxylase I family protein